jgi:hypothetical protein
MNNIARACGLIAIFFVGSACNPFGPANYPGFFRFSVDNGAEQAATSNGRLALDSGGALSLTGTNCDSGQFMSIGIPAPLGTGPRTVSNVFASYQADASASNGSPSYTASSSSPGSGGSVTIDSLTKDRVKGSFDLTLVPFNAPGSKRIVGTFELEIADKTIC